MLVVIAMKAYWSVRAGLIPGESVPEYGEQWVYTSQDFEADGNKRGERFEANARKASDHARKLSAGGLNWVEVRYLWL